MPSAKFCRNPFSTKFCRIPQKSVESTEICRITYAADVRPLPTTSWLRVTSALWCNSPTKQSTCPPYKIVPCRRAKHTNLPNVLGWNLHSSIRYIHWKHYLKNSYSIGEDIMSLLRCIDIQEHRVLRPPSGAGSWTCGERNSWHLLSNTARNDNKHRHMGGRRPSEYSCSTICWSQGPHQSIMKLH